MSELLASAQKKESTHLDESSFDQLNALTKEFGSLAQNIDPSSAVEPFDTKPNTTKNVSSIGFKEIAGRLEKKGRKTSAIKLRFKTVRDAASQEKSKSTITPGSIEYASKPKINGKILKLGSASKSALQKACETRKPSIIS